MFDTHWLVNANYHINCAPHFRASTPATKLPHFISNLPFELPGQPGTGQDSGEDLQRDGRGDAGARCDDAGPEYGTLVPMRYMNADQHFKVVSVSALCTVHYLNDSARLGWAMRRAVEEHYDGIVAFCQRQFSVTASRRMAWRRSTLSRSGARCSNRSITA